MPERAYINMRRWRGAMAGRQPITEALTEWDQLRIKSALGQKYRRTSRVVVRRPWWMPARVFWWLLSTIVAEAK